MTPSKDNSRILASLAEGFEDLQAISTLWETIRDTVAVTGVKNPPFCSARSLGGSPIVCQSSSEPVQNSIEYVLSLQNIQNVCIFGGPLDLDAEDFFEIFA